MTIHTIYTLGIMSLLIATLFSRRGGPDIAFLCALALLLIGDAILPTPSGGGHLLTATEAVEGFANPAVITVGLLYMVAQGLRVTGGMTTITSRLLGRPQSMLIAQSRLLLPVAGLSAFMNNTPIVAMFLPVLSGWAKRCAFNPSRFFMPLSFAAMLGGTCTLIGTSTNLVVDGLLTDISARNNDINDLHFDMFTLAPIGGVILFAGMAYLLFAGRLLLPSTDDRSPIAEDPREYTVWMEVAHDGPMAGRTIEDAGLRHLSGLFLTAIERDDEQIVAVPPEHVLRSGDRIQFAGDVESVVELQQMPGLNPNTEQIHKLAHPRHARRLTEAVVSRSSPLVGKSVRDGGFRNRYHAVIIAVHRAGERVAGKIGDIVLRPGDTLLLEAPPGFAKQHAGSSAFYLVSEREDAPTPRWGRAWMAIGLLAALVILLTAQLLPVMTAALVIAMLMILTRCCTGTQARQAIDWQVLIIIGAAFGIARAMENSGAAALLAEYVLAPAGALGPAGLLAGVYLVTVLLTSVMTNNAAAALVFPIAVQCALLQGQDIMPVAICIAVGASTSFMTPIGYQTNLMVMGPGGYTWMDFLRFGGPLTIISGVLCVVLAPIFYGVS